jgi:hypothetical protein
VKKALAFRGLYKLFTASQKTKEEIGWASKTINKKKFKIGKYKFAYERRDKSGVMGRFGGGWQYKLGIDIGGSTVILNLLVATLRIDHEKDKEGLK